MIVRDDARLVVVKARQLPERHELSGKVLDLTQGGYLVGRDEGVGMTGGSGSSRAANAMHVILGVHGYVKVHDSVNAAHVDAAAHHVGCHEDLHLAPTKALERSLARLLGTIRMHDINLDACLLEVLLQVIGATLGAAEHEYTVGPLSRGATRVKEGLKELDLLALDHGTKMLLHSLCGLSHAGDLDGDGIGEHRVDRALDGRGNGGREEQRLALLWTGRDNAANAGPEAHVKHAVGLIEHQALHAVEVHVVVIHEVDEASRRGDEQVAACLESLDLALELCASHDDDGPLSGLLADDRDDLLDLRCELARGGHHQSEWPKGMGVGVRLP